MLSPEMRRRLRQLEFISKRQIEGLAPGRCASIFKGQGVEFAEVREYQAGDDVRYLDWSVSARLGRPFIKLNVEERELSLIFAVDASLSMDIGSAAGTKLDSALQAAALLAYAAEGQGHKTGLLLFAGGVERYLPPQQGSSQVQRLLGEIGSVRKRGRGTDLAGALRFLNRCHPRRALVFLLSDLLDPRFGTPAYVSAPEKNAAAVTLSKDTARILRLTCRRHDLAVLRIAAAGERELPDVGTVRWRDAETGRMISVNTSNAELRRRYAENMAAYGAAWRSLVRGAGGRYAELSGGEELLPQLLAFMSQRKESALR